MDLTDFRGFLNFSGGFLGQKLSQKDPQGRGFYHRKYGPAISHGGPIQAQTTFWTWAPFFGPGPWARGSSLGPLFWAGTLGPNNEGLKTVFLGI